MRVDGREAPGGLDHGREGGGEDGRGRLRALRASPWRGREGGAGHAVGAPPCVFQGRWRQIAPVAPGDGRPEMQTMGFVDAIEPGHVDILPLVEVLDVVGDQP